MKRFAFTILIIAVFSMPAQAKYSGGTGEPSDPYQIATKQDLLDLAANTTDYGKCFIITADIDMQGQGFTTAIIAADVGNIPTEFDGTTFTGTFDGNSHKIINFHINGGEYLGLFGYIDSGGSVKNLGLEDYAINGSSSSWYVGGLVGLNGGSISNCHSTGAVSGSSDSYDVGGLVGSNGGSISNCYSTGAVSGESRVGGDRGHELRVCFSCGHVYFLLWGFLLL